jgi:hypothetical protein
VLTTPEEVAAALSGTPLASLPAGYGPRGTILIRDVVPGDLLDSWRAAHARMPVTGRWPVLVTDDWDRGWLELRSLPDPSAPTAPELAEFDQKALTIDPWPSFERDDEPVTEAEWVAFFAQGSYTDVAWSEEALRQIELPTTSSTVERWAYERVLADPALTDRVRQGARWSVQIGNWHTPDRVSLLLLPTASPWLAAYWVDFYGAMGWAPGLGAVLRQWHEQFGARLVASWGTMLQLLVDKPPQSIEQAWEVAGQIQGLASHYEGHRWELAVALPESEAWFLHNRP